MLGTEQHGPITVFYPSSGAAQSVQRGPFPLQVAWNGEPEAGNGRLIVISHGSAASPWVYSDLARTLVDAGFVVALPEHFADNYKDASEIGPPSWQRRPLEISHAIDALSHDAQLSPLLQLDRVGMYGMSAGGHTALTLAGGRWSPAQLRRHCERHIAEDFQSCVGLTTHLTGGFFDQVKMWLALAVIRHKFTEESWYAYVDPRITAIVAGVPYAADFDVASLAAPAVPLGLVTAAADQWLRPQFHSEVVVQACKPCERVAEIASGGHGALLSPLPPHLTGLLAALIDDPPGFDRARIVPEVHGQVTAFFVRHLLARTGAEGSVPSAFTPC